MKLITCRDVSFAYEGNVVVEGITFDVEEGEYVCIVGENGSGKSTLIKGILGLIKPKLGSIDRSSDLKSFEIGYLPQQSIVQRDFPASVFEVVLSGRLAQRGLSPFYSKIDKSIARENIERLKISDISDKSYRELSGGQQQRVLLARALCSTGKILLLDEPVAGLDPIVTLELYEVIREINKTLRIAIIMVSHDIVSSVKYSDKILHLQNKQLYFGSSNQYAESEIGRRFLGGEEIYE